VLLEHEDSIELGDGAPTPVLAAHNERLKQGIAQLQNGKIPSPAKPARHDSVLELRVEDAAGSQMASSATKDTSLGESVQVRQKARIGAWRRRRRSKFKTPPLPTVKAVTKVVKLPGFKAVSKSVKHMAKNFSKGIKKVNSMAQEAAQKRNAALANEAAQKRNAAVAKEAAQKAAAKVKAAAEKAVKAVKKNAARVVKKAVKKEVKKDVKKYVATDIRRRRVSFSRPNRSWSRL